MKLSIRWKFFIILLAFSILPLLFLREMIGQAGGEVLDEVTTRTRTEVGQLIRLGLESSVVAAADVLEGEGTAITLSARMLALATENSLASEGGSQSGYFLASRDMMARSRESVDSGENRYFMKTPMGRRKQLSVDMQQVAILLPGGMDESQAKAEIDALSNLLPFMKELYQTIQPYWLHVNLASGIRAVYPGHSGYPMMYDARLTDWYKRAAAADKPTWTSPVVDPVTRRVMATAAMPIKYADGKLIGVAAVDIPLSDSLMETRLGAEWGGEQRSFLVTRAKNEQGATGLMVLAQRDYETRHANWHMGIERDWLQSDDRKAFDHFLNRVETEESGLMQMPYKGEPSIWAFASRDTYAFIIILPESALESYPARVSDSIMALFHNLRSYSLIGIFVVCGLVGLFAFYWSNKSTKPLLAMASTARRLSEGDFSTKLDMRLGDERDLVISTLNDMGPKLQEHMIIRQDMELASTVQELLLPDSAPDLPGYDIAGSLLYSDQTGGDYFDFLPVEGRDGSAFAVVVGDVTGHGMQAALLMATARALLQGISGTRTGLERRIELVNNSLSRDLEETGRFMTMFYLQLSPDSAMVRWVRAGHDPALTLKPDSDEFGELRGEGLPLGVAPDMKYEPGETDLVPGELVILATDGLWEAHSPEGEMFGKERLLAIVRQNRDKDPDEIVRAAFEAVTEHVGRAGREDDMTMVVIRRKHDAGQQS
ncbi:SpoIIE family protein phosphatase [Salidesulfovibrio brasiliensis]|uniref:SpoIIE family protein phosphatase n=1 Tax=Salidesulfovibrio brasiliensis TaxID=221711 RepID=UPI0006D0AA28|nr:SpoIIE family protein phosphatase [Salidesulfovibrio brasiliensis]